MSHKYETEARGHVWKRDEDDGEIDIFAYEGGEYHNGPLCVNCGYGFCHHCNDLPDEACSKPALEGEFTTVNEQKLLGSVDNGTDRN